MQKQLNKITDINQLQINIILIIMDKINLQITNIQTLNITFNIKLNMINKSNQIKKLIN